MALNVIGFEQTSEQAQILFGLKVLKKDENRTVSETIEAKKEDFATNEIREAGNNLINSFHNSRIVPIKKENPKISDTNLPKWDETKIKEKNSNELKLFEILNSNFMKSAFEFCEKFPNRIFIQFDSCIELMLEIVNSNFSINTFELFKGTQRFFSNFSIEEILFLKEQNFWMVCSQNLKLIQFLGTVYENAGISIFKFLKEKKIFPILKCYPYIYLNSEDWKILASIPKEEIIYYMNIMEQGGKAYKLKDRTKIQIPDSLRIQISNSDIKNEVINFLNDLVFHHFINNIDSVVQFLEQKFVQNFLLEHKKVKKISNKDYFPFFDLLQNNHVVDFLFSEIEFYSIFLKNNIFGFLKQKNYL